MRCLSGFAATMWLASCNQARHDDHAETVSAATAVVQTYSRLLRGSPPNADSLVALFAPSGEILNPGMAAVRGPAKIKEFLASFGQVTVEKTTFVIDTVETNGTTAYVWGWATQRYQLPGQEPGETQGRGLYVVRKQADGTWRIEKALTQPAPASDAPGS